MKARRALATALVATFVAVAGAAHADATADADQFFDKGIEAMDQGHYNIACPLLQKSVDLKVRPGALYHLAECYDKAGKISSAVHTYDRTIRFIATMPPEEQAKDANVQRVAVAKDRIAALKPVVPTVTLLLPQNAPAGTVVKLDGSEIPSAALGSPWDVDPGDHSVSTLPPGGKEKGMPFTISSGEKKTLDLEVDLSAPPPPPGGGGGGGGSGVVVDTAAPTPTAAYVVGGIGVAGLAVGSIFGLMAMSKASTVKDNCVETACNATGFEAASSAKSSATISTIGFGVGIVGIAVGTYLLLSAPKTTAPSAAALVVPPPKRPSWEPIVSTTTGGAFFGLRGDF